MTDKSSHFNQPENRNKVETSSILRQRGTAESTITAESRRSENRAAQTAQRDLERES